jgi:DNA-directed RNA polymerase subunit RPC12/RpoP
MKKCDGLKNGKKCESNVYKCLNCGAIGCDQVGCSKRNFQGMECKQCGTSSSGRQPVY